MTAGRRIDRDHMLRMMDLHDYDTVRTHATAIALRLRNGTMPPASTGGPWPDEWLALFDRWVAAGFPRLDLAAGTTILNVLPNNRLELRASGSVGGQGVQVWFDLRAIGEAQRHYALSAEQEPPGSGGGSAQFTAIERMPRGLLRSILVTDANGTQEIMVPV